MAGIPVEVHCQYPETKEFCRGYLTDTEPQFTVTITEEDVNAERKHFSDSNRIAGNDAEQQKYQQRHSQQHDHGLEKPFQNVL